MNFLVNFGKGFSHKYMIAHKTCSFYLKINWFCLLEIQALTLNYSLF